MKNEELIKALRYHADATIRYCDECPYQSIHKINGMCLDSLISDAADALEAAQPEPQWILCSERLPEQGKPVLVTYIYNGKRFVAESWYIGLHDERGNPLFSSCADEYKASDLYFQKVAWMPLPEPWNGN